MEQFDQFAVELVVRARKQRAGVDPPRPTVQIRHDCPRFFGEERPSGGVKRCDREEDVRRHAASCDVGEGQSCAKRPEVPPVHLDCCGSEATCTISSSSRGRPAVDNYRPGVCTGPESLGRIIHQQPGTAPTLGNVHCTGRAISDDTDDHLSLFDECHVHCEQRDARGKVACPTDGVHQPVRRTGRRLDPALFPDDGDSEGVSCNCPNRILNCDICISHHVPPTLEVNSAGAPAGPGQCLRHGVDG